MIYLASLDDEQEEIIDGKLVLTTLGDVYRIIHREDTEKLIFKQSFIDKFFSDTGFKSFTIECKKLNNYLKVEYPARYTFEDDKDIEELKSIKNYEDLLDYTIYHKQDAIKTIQKIYSLYEKNNSETLLANSKLASLYLELSECKEKLKQSEQRELSTNNILNKTTRKLNSLIAKINGSHGIDAPIESIKITNNRYRKVLYIKELTRVIYTDTLIKYLMEILKTLQGIPTRLLVIEAQDAIGKGRLYPDCKHFVDLSLDDVFNQNIFMSGFQNHIAESILKNPSSVEYLIVLDRSGSEDPFIYGHNVEQLTTVSDLKDLQNTNDLSRVISYSKDTLYIPHIDNFNELNAEVRIREYSSLSIMRSLIDLLER